MKSLLATYAAVFLVIFLGGWLYVDWRVRNSKERQAAYHQRMEEAITEQLYDAQWVLTQKGYSDFDAERKVADAKKLIRLDHDFILKVMEASATDR